MNLIVRNERIDFLRGIAIFLVLALHFHLSYKLFNSYFAVVLPENLLNAILHNGNYGVTMFFVISGYLITSRTLQRHGSLSNISLSNFYKLRFARIFPCLILALLIIFSLSLFDSKSFVNKSGIIDSPQVSMSLSILSVLTFWHNVLMEQYGYFNYAMNIYWSLSVEEVFYLAFPIICMFLRKKSQLLTLILLLMICGPVYRYIHRDNELFYMYGYLGCFDAIAYGCLAAVLYNSNKIKVLQHNLIQSTAAIILIVTYMLGIHNHETFGFSIIAMMTAILLLGNKRALIPQNIVFKAINRFIGFLGRMSYELYLFHIIILGVMRQFLTAASLSNGQLTYLYFAFFGLSVFVAWLCYKYYSEPLNNKIRNISIDFNNRKIYDNMI